MEKRADPMDRIVSAWLCPKTAMKQTIPAIARRPPITKVTLGMSIVVRPVYHKSSMPTSNRACAKVFCRDEEFWGEEKFLNRVESDDVNGIRIRRVSWANKIAV
ncbi:MAG TPA: hypothetical protein VJA94_19605 [Candidatus Angelobacter sp.]